MHYTNERDRLELKRVTELREDIHEAERRNFELYLSAAEVHASAEALLSCLNKLRDQISEQEEAER